MAGESKQASHNFMDAVCEAGTPDMTCQLCDRHCFATGSQTCLSDVEIDKYRKSSNENPHRYWECADDSLAYGVIDGKQCVYDCPCNGMARYENFIWTHRHMITRYLRKRSESIKAECEDVLASLAIG